MLLFFIVVYLIYCASLNSIIVLVLEIRTEAVKEALMNHHKKESLMPMSCKRTSAYGQSRPVQRRRNISGKIQNVHITSPLFQLHLDITVSSKEFCWLHIYTNSSVLYIYISS